MQFRSFVAAPSAVTAVCVCSFLFLLRAEALFPGPLPGVSAGFVAQQEAAQALQSRLAGQTAQLALLYQARNYRPFWFNQNGLSGDGRQALALLAAADKDGLPALRYAAPLVPDPRAPFASKADFDIALTGALLRYAADMRWGVFRPEQLFDDAAMERDFDDVGAGLARAADSGMASAYLRSLAPPLREYGQLRDGLARYRAIAAAGDWPSVTMASSSGNMTRLAARLQLEGYLAEPASPASIAAALRAFQAGNATAPTGQLNERTVALLNVAAAARADVIAVNMERLRWMPHAPGSQYILVNVPDASLALMVSGQPALVSKVVVGARNKSTPILSTKAVSITINPSWHVPASIVRREIRPKGGGYMAAKNMYVRDGQVIQRPGPGNALGRAKFEMPNSFDVYLHDTPTKKAFLASDRALSHGCVRVQQIRPLAGHVLGLSDEEVQRLIDRGSTSGQRLAAPIPVYIQYWTAIPRENGQIGFRDDVYGRDARMTRALFPGGLRVAELNR
jgi:murein L,D-transpeptidase YcbB/YkuD